MVKKLFALALVAALGVAFAMPAMAEVKSIKVGGDLTIRGIVRNNLDFQKDSGDDNNNGFGMTTARIFVAAELSDNVSVMVRLLNEQVWDGYSDEESWVYVDLAYVKLADLFVPGLTATIGQQEITLGKGFVINTTNPFGSDYTLWSDLQDLTARKAFNAVRLDYEVGVVPLTITAIRAKIYEDSDYYDEDLTALNFKYKIGDNADIEAYLIDSYVGGWSGGNSREIYTLGLRGDHNVLSVPGLAYSLELAMQTGDTGWDNYDQEAWAGTVDVSYTFANPYQPKIGIGWTMLSGDDPATSDKGEGWDYTFSNQSDRIGLLTYALGVSYGDFFKYYNPGNLSVPKIYGSFKPADKHLVTLAFYPDTQLNEKVFGYSSTSLLWEADLGWTYQYTSDVSFGLLFAYAKAGDWVKEWVGTSSFDDTTYEVIGTVAVAF